VGRRYGLTAVAVGRILDAHRLRERIDTSVDGYDSPLHLIRGISEGYAVWDEVSGREFWIVEKVATLLADRKAG
jgi:hypothetical protein